MQLFFPMIGHRPESGQSGSRPTQPEFAADVRDTARYILRRGWSSKFLRSADLNHRVVELHEHLFGTTL
jgi:hypothetical protein